MTITIEGEGEILLRQGKPYEMTPIESPVDITIQNNVEILVKARDKYPHLALDEWEYIKTGLDFARALLDFDGFCLHSSAVAVNNMAVLFSAPCGTGKSTHAGLWQRHFGSEKALILNDDKPALRFIRETFYVYGTPWSGKNDLSSNRRVPLRAIVFMERAKENHIYRLNNKQAVKMLIYQALCPGSERDKMNKLMILLDTLIKRIPVYGMGCTIGTEAVEMVYNEINSGLCNQK